MNSHIPVYMVVNLTVQDAAAYRNYERGFFAILKRYGGEFLTFDDAHITLEGSKPPSGRMIIFKFPSKEQATSWYADPEYQTLSEFRRQGTQLEYLTLLHGLPARA